jgi:hypothetical protein
MLPTTLPLDVWPEVSAMYPGRRLGYGGQNRIPAAYAIETPVGAYVGVSADVISRWGTHRRWLLRGEHSARHLQRAYDAFVEDTSFVLLEVLPEGLCKDEMFKHEIYHAKRVMKKKPLLNTFIGDHIMVNDRVYLGHRYSKTTTPHRPKRSFSVPYSWVYDPKTK